MPHLQTLIDRLTIYLLDHKASEDVQSTKCKETIEKLQEAIRAQHQDFAKQISILQTQLYDTKCKATDLTVSNHACQRYIERVHKTATIEEARKILYTSVLKSAAMFDVIPDGKYTISKNTTAVVENQAVVTVYK